jgi:alkanesulfonate monooxygenase SsuD/methylene tetrahydromethanopterin reductase-like flavin-dependent oxidoreductase (luciferase family)
MVQMGGRVGLAINAGSGWKPHDIGTAARDAEDAGFEAIFTAEIRTDGIAIALFMGTQTKRIKVGTCVSNIYLRHSLVCAQAAAFASEVTNGRMILGLGVSHPVVNTRYGIDMGQSLPALRSYVAEVRRHVRGEGPGFPSPPVPCPYPVPIYLAALTSKALEQAAEIGDGIMPVFWPASRVEKSQVWIERGHAKAPERPKTDFALALPVFVGDDLEAMRHIARHAMTPYAAVPTYQRLFRTCGFEEEASKAEQGAMAEAISDRLLDAFCLVGPAARCREHLVDFRESGVDLPILYTPLGLEAVQDIVEAFRQ